MSFQRLSIFDLDETLVQGNASALFFRYVQKREFSWATFVSFFSYFFRYRYMRLDLNELHKCVFRQYLYAQERAFFTGHLDGFLTKLLPDKLYVPAILRLAAAKQMGHYTLILSNSPDFIVGPIAEYLGVHEWRATEYVVDSQGRFEKIGFVCHGRAKADILRDVCQKLGIRREHTYAYSDSIHDLELLRIAGHPTIVNPDRELKQIGKLEGWEIL